MKRASLALLIVGVLASFGMSAGGIQSDSPPSNGTNISGVTGDTTITNGVSSTHNIRWRTALYTFGSQPPNPLNPATANYYDCNSSGGAYPLNLPAATGSGQPFTIKKTDSSANACTVTPNGPDNIDGSATVALTAQFQKLVIVDARAGVWEIVHLNVDVNNLGQVINGSHLGAATVPSTALATVQSAQGGSGVASPTAHGLLIGEGASPVVAYVCPNNLFLAGVTSADPACRAIAAADLPTLSAATNGVAPIIYSHDNLAQGAAIADVTMFTVGGTSSVYRFSGEINCTATSAAAQASLNLKWTDTGSQAQSATVSDTCTALGSGSIADVVKTIRAKTGTVITYGVTITNTPTYDVSVTLEVLR